MTTEPLVRDLRNLAYLLEMLLVGNVALDTLFFRPVLAHSELIRYQLHCMIEHPETMERAWELFTGMDRPDLNKTNKEHPGKTLEDFELVFRAWIPDYNVCTISLDIQSEPMKWWINQLLRTTAKPVNNMKRSRRLSRHEHLRIKTIQYAMDRFNHWWDACIIVSNALLLPYRESTKYGDAWDEADVGAVTEPLIDQVPYRQRLYNYR